MLDATVTGVSWGRCLFQARTSTRPWSSREWPGCIGSTQRTGCFSPWRKMPASMAEGYGLMRIQSHHGNTAGPRQRQRERLRIEALVLTPFASKTRAWQAQRVRPEGLPWASEVGGLVMWSSRRLVHISSLTPVCPWGQRQSFDEPPKRDSYVGGT